MSIHRVSKASKTEVKTRLIDEWVQFDQSIVDASISQWLASKPLYPYNTIQWKICTQKLTNTLSV